MDCVLAGDSPTQISLTGRDVVDQHHLSIQAHIRIILVGQVRYLRNRKHVPCFYRVIETRVKVWENEKCCGNASRRRVFPQLFRVLPNFHSCFYNSIGTRRTRFLFLLENTATKKKKNNLFTSIIKM